MPVTAENHGLTWHGFAFACKWLQYWHLNDIDVNVQSSKIAVSLSCIHYEQNMSLEMK